MKYIDIFLAFTSCEGMCLFCEKGNDLIFFKREEYKKTHYKRHHISSELELYNLFNKKDIGKYNICISGYEPLKYEGLPRYIEYLKELFPNSTFTLRTSGIDLLSKNIIDLFYNIELSIYGSSEHTHNIMVGNNTAWEKLHVNISLIQEMNQLHKLHFQTIFLKENIFQIKEIIGKIQSYSTGNSIKIIYPYFMPKKRLDILCTRKEIIIRIITFINRDTIKKDIQLVNFKISSPEVTSYFQKIIY